MLNQAEAEILALLRASPLARRLRRIDTMPELSETDLVKHFAMEAPALYIDSAPFSLKYPRTADLRFELLVVARSTRPQSPGKPGDGIAIGLHDLVDACLSLIAGVSTQLFSWRVVSVDFLKNSAFFAAGFCPASIALAAEAEIDSVDDINLADFKTFHADYDVEPHQPRSEHDKWLQEPPDHNQSAPELSDTLTLQE